MTYLLQRSDVRKAIVTRQYYNSVYGWQPPSYWNGGLCIGTGIYSILHSYKVPRVMPFSLNPVQHRRFLGSSSLVNCTIVDDHNRPVYRFSGDLAACIGGHPPDYSPYDSDQRKLTEAVVGAAAKLQEPDVDYGLMLAEARETMDLIPSLVDQLHAPIKRMMRPNGAHRGKWGFLQSKASWISKAWLTYRYAIMPLISDVNAAVQKTTQQLTPKIGFRRKGKGYVDPEIKNRVCDVVGFNSCYFTRENITSVQYRYVSHIFYEIIDYVAAERTRLGLDISQLPSIAYELIPYSFVLDWFVDVGSWIKASTPNPAYVKKGNTASTIVIRSGSTTTFMGSLYADASYASPANSSYIWREQFYDRGVNVALPGLPQVNADFLSIKRTADACALSWNKVKRLIH